MSARANSAFTASLFEGLEHGGVRHVCVSPGSRSTPLTVAAVRSSSLRCWSHLDERSAAFFALGLAKCRREPVALVCTSGTAAANFHPAVLEAHHSRTPLLLLTADRPPELRDWGAGQTIDQVQLYGTAVRWFVDAPVPEEGAGPERYARALASRAVAAACGRPAGPVHLNLPFREPLGPAENPGPKRDRAAQRSGDVPPRALSGASSPSPDLVVQLLERLRAAQRGVISCGPLNHPDAADSIAALARALGWPLLAEPTSQLRRGPHVAATPVVTSSDLFLRDAETARRLAPDCVLRFGDTPTSKAFRSWLEQHPPTDLVVVDPDRAWHDPSQLASLVLAVDPELLCDHLLRRLPAAAPAASPWLQRFLSAERASTAAVEAAVSSGDELLEPRAVRELAAALPANAVLYVSNSMPVRDLDAFLPLDPTPLGVLCNRGVNGIDGMVSSALGAAAGLRDSKRRVVLLTGDLAFLHDAGALLAARRHQLDATIVVLDNNGGGIFSFLPIAEHGAAVDFEEQFRSPHHLDLGAVARAYGARSVRIGSWEHFRAAFKDAGTGPGVSVIEVPVDRDRSVAHHREVERRVAEALRRQEPGPTRSAGIRLHRCVEGSGPPLLLLHGFSGSSESLDDAASRLQHRFQTIRLDLIGHGRSPSPTDPSAYSMQSCVAQIVDALDELGIESAHVLGYSMGGRVALALGAWQPERVRSALLVGASAGLADARRRVERVARDEALASRIESGGLISFVDEWMSQALFATQQRLGSRALAVAREQRLASDPIGLAGSLRGMGSGAQPPLQHLLRELRTPLLFVAGERDVKFSAIASSLASLAPEADCCVVPRAGHAVHLEEPEAFGRIANSFFSDMEQRR